MALIVAARAHEINARREWGDYRHGRPQSAGVPPSELPGSAGGNATAAPTLAPPVQHASSDSPPDAMPISESFALFTPTQTNWSAGYRRQADQALLLFISLMGDLPVNRITGDVAETFRNRLKALPAKHGKSIYAGMSPSQATISAERLREAMTAPGNVIQFGKQSLPRAQADMLSKTSDDEDGEQAPHDVHVLGQVDGGERDAQRSPPSRQVTVRREAFQQEGSEEGAAAGWSWPDGISAGVARHDVRRPALPRSSGHVAQQ